MIKVTQGDVQAFLANEQIKASFEEAMALKVNVPKWWVTALLSATRRLAEGSAHLRRLTSDVTVTYTIRIPYELPATGAGSAVSAATIQTIMSSTTVASLTSAIDTQLAQ